MNTYEIGEIIEATEFLINKLLDSDNQEVREATELLLSGHDTGELFHNLRQRLFNEAVVEIKLYVEAGWEGYQNNGDYNTMNTLLYGIPQHMVDKLRDHKDKLYRVSHRDEIKASYNKAWGEYRDFNTFVRGLYPIRLYEWTPQNILQAMVEKLEHGWRFSLKFERNPFWASGDSTIWGEISEVLVEKYEITEVETPEMVKRIISKR